MLSIIIPVLNEETTIRSLLDHLQESSSGHYAIEVVVVDGGSTDRTLQILKNYDPQNPDFHLHSVSGEKGRAKQLHLGAQKAKGDILYFLHADSYPPKDYDQHITKAVQHGNPAGCFKMKFKSWHPWLVIIGWFTRFSWKVSRGGDQSQYITAALYQEIGGYNTSLPIYEDYDLITRLYTRGQYHVIPKWLKTSARRYHEKGVLHLQWFYLCIYWRKYRGASIDEIYQYYLSKCN